MKAPLRYSTVFQHPPERVMAYGTTLLPDLTGSLPNITRIEALGEDAGEEGRRRIHYRFYVKPSMMLPPWLAFFSPLLKPFTWLQWFELDEPGNRVIWRVDPEGVPAKTWSEGVTSLTPTAEGCRLNLKGHFFLTIVGHVPGPEMLLTQVEEWITPRVKEMVESNLASFYDGLNTALNQRFS